MADNRQSSLKGKASQNKKNLKKRAEQNQRSGNRNQKGDSYNSRKKRRKKMRTSHKVLIGITIGILVVILALLLFAFWLINDKYSKSNYVPMETVTFDYDQLDDDQKELLTDPDDDELITDEYGSTIEELNSEELAALESQMNEEQQNNIPNYNTGGVINILLIGVDRRDTSWAGNSDTMILVTINKNTQKIVMTSILRDTYMNIPGVGNYKVNRAHALSGASLLVPTISQNLNVKIDYYASVDFTAFTHCIDALGGVSMAVTDAEVVHVNNYLKEINRLQGLPEGSGALPGGGTYHLNGRQALAYSRIRYIGTDIARTGRQRAVLMAVLNQIKSSGLGTLNSVADAVLPYITHNIPSGDLTGLIFDAINFINYPIESVSFPYEGAYTFQRVGNDSVIVPDWGNCLNRLHTMMYQ